MRILVLITLIVCYCVVAPAMTEMTWAQTPHSKAFLEPPSGKPHIFPNPAVDYIQITDKSQRVKAVHIYNLLGRQMLGFDVSHSGKCNISTLPKGIYLVQMLDAQGKIIATQRLHKR